MDYQLDDEFRSICQEIVAEEKTEEEWAKVEAADMFQTRKYNGGFDAGEREFCLSAYLADGEYWFRVSQKQVQLMTDGINVVIDVPDDHRVAAGTIDHQHRYVRVESDIQLMTEVFEDYKSEKPGSNYCLAFSRPGKIPNVFCERFEFCGGNVTVSMASKPMCLSLDGDSVVTVKAPAYSHSAAIA